MSYKIHYGLANFHMPYIISHNFIVCPRSSCHYRLLHIFYLPTFDNTIESSATAVFVASLAAFHSANFIAVVWFSLTIASCMLFLISTECFGSISFSCRSVFFLVASFIFCFNLCDLTATQMYYYSLVCALIRIILEKCFLHPAVNTSWKLWLDVLLWAFISSTLTNGSLMCAI